MSQDDSLYDEMSGPSRKWAHGTRRRSSKILYAEALDVLDVLDQHSPRREPDAWEVYR